MSITSLKKAIDKAGGQTSLARLIDRPPIRRCTQGHISGWLVSVNPDRMPPAEYCPDIERVTGIPCEELRPDVNWSVIRGSHVSSEVEANDPVAVSQ